MSKKLISCKTIYTQNNVDIIPLKNSYYIRVTNKKGEMLTLERAFNITTAKAIAKKFIMIY